MEINSSEYWENRFGTNWEECGGRSQTAFFAQMLLDGLPAAVRDEIRDAHMSIADFGCALGECAALFKAEFPESRVSGLDFSSRAVTDAKALHPECEFARLDILADVYPCDVAICSNVLEHFPDPRVPFGRLLKMARKYVLIMVPMEDNDGIAEHVSRFTVDFFPLVENRFALSYARILTSRSPKDWPGKQLLVVYRHLDMGQDLAFSAFGGVTQAVAEVLLEQKTLGAVVASVQDGGSRALAELAALREANARLQDEVSATRDAVAAVQAEMSAARAELQTAYQYLNNILWEVREVRRHQNRGWIRNFILGVPGMPLVAGKIKNVYRRARRDGVRKALAYYRAKYLFGNAVTGGNVRVKDLIAREMKSGKYRGVYVIPTIPWDVPIFQRPQQMALAFLRKGYLVIYLEYAQENPVGTFSRPLPGLCVLTVGDFGKAIEGISGCIVSICSTVLCWREGITDAVRQVLRDNTVVYEYIDHFSEKISGDSTGVLRSFFDGLTFSGLPVHYLASARNLKSELEERTGRHVMYVANGVDAAHFSATNIREIAKRVQLPACLTSDRVKIGYFGALAPWLDYELLSQVAMAHSEWDFIFIGPDYLGGSDGIPKRDNCKWIGPVAYNDLPAYAARFDVAILPFQSGDIAKSTSPLKLFEYFALGKPVVVTQDMAECTAFPEVFRGAGSAGFAAGISDALRAKDDPKFQERMRRLAEENTWDARADSLLKGLEET